MRIGVTGETCGRGARLGEVGVEENVCGTPVRRATVLRERQPDCRLDSARMRDLLRSELRGVRTVHG
jgi:hypothetical protein